MLDKKYSANEKENKWLNYWKENGIYDFKSDHREVYSIDTPPPTVNGKIHIGHIFSYTQTEMIARYKRLRGYNVFYPFGFDDNGLPSERLVEKEQGKKAHEIGRENCADGVKTAEECSCNSVEAHCGNCGRSAGPLLEVGKIKEGSAEGGNSAGNHKSCNNISLFCHTTVFCCILV